MYDYCANITNTLKRMVSVFTKSNKRNKSGKYGNYLIITLLLSVVLAMLYLKYKEEVFSQYNLKYTKQDYYKEMGLSKSATAAEVKTKFRDLSVELHPDKNPDCKDCPMKFQKVNEAYKILGDSMRRKVYDETFGVLLHVKSDIPILKASEIRRAKLLRKPVVLLLHNSYCAYTQSALPVFEQFSERIKNYAMVGRVVKEECADVLKMLPVTPIALPAVMMLTDNDLQFKMLPDSSDLLIKWFVSIYPNRAYPNMLNAFQARKTLGHDHQILFAYKKKSVQLEMNRIIYKLCKIVDLGIISTKADFALFKSLFDHVKLDVGQSDVAVILFEKGVYKHHLMASSDESNVQDIVFKLISLLVITVEDNSALNILCQSEEQKKFCIAAVNDTNPKNLENKNIETFKSSVNVSRDLVLQPFILQPIIMKYTTSYSNTALALCKLSSTHFAFDNYVSKNNLSNGGILLNLDQKKWAKISFKALTRYMQNPLDFSYMEWVSFDNQVLSDKVLQLSDESCTIFSITRALLLSK